MSDYDSDSSMYNPANDSPGRNGDLSGQRSRSRSGSASRRSDGSYSDGSGGNRSRSNSASSRSGSPGANSIRSRSSSGSHLVNGSPAQNGSIHSRSRSVSRSRSRSVSSRSRSPSGSRSRSRSVSRSKSRSISRSRSRSRSGSRSVSRSRSRSISRSKSRSVSRDKSRSVSRSDHGSNRSRSRSSRSGTPPPLEVNVSDHSDEDRASVRSGTPSSPPNGEVPREEDLFGDALDLSDEENDLPRVDDLDEKEEEEEPKEELPPEVRIDADIPKIVTDLGREVHFVKLPNFLSVETRPFDSETYEDELDDEETLDEEGRARIKLRVENTMRWRTNFDKEGNAIQESNTKLVKWSDGSMSLHLGSEIFDIYRQPLQGDHNHLFIRQGTGLQGQAIFRTKLSFRPHSTDSFTHRKITLSMADRSHKNVGVKVLSTVTNDPEVKRNESLRRDEDRLKASQRRESKQKRVRDRSSGAGLTRGFIEDDDESGPSLMAIKQEMKRKAKDPRPIYSSDEEDSDIETRPSKRIERAKRGLEDSEDESDSGAAKRRRSSDSEGSDGKGSTPRRSRSRSSGSSRSRSSRSRSSSAGSSRSGSGSRSSGRSSPAGSRSGSGSESN